MIHLICPESERESAEGLGFKTFTYPPHSYLPKDVVIRHGYSGPINGTPVQINNAESIRLNVQKHKALKKLSKVVNTPRLYEKEVPKNKLVISRPYSHTEGKDYRLLKGPFKLEKGYYAVDAIKTDIEYRIWFVGDKVKMARRFTYSKKEKAKKYPSRSLWGFSFYDKTYKKLKKLVLKGAKQLGIEMGCADILYKNGKYYFLEYNTASTFYHDEIINWHKKYIKSLIKKKLKKVKIIKPNKIYLSEIWNNI